MKAEGDIIAGNKQTGNFSHAGGANIGGSLHVNVGGTRNDVELDYEEFVMTVLEINGELQPARVHLEERRKRLGLSIRVARDIEAACIEHKGIKSAAVQGLQPRRDPLLQIEASPSVITPDVENEAFHSLPELPGCSNCSTASNIKEIAKAPVGEHCSNPKKREEETDGAGKSDKSHTKTPRIHANGERHDFAEHGCKCEVCGREIGVLSGGHPSELQCSYCGRWVITQYTKTKQHLLWTEKMERVDHECWVKDKGCCSICAKLLPESSCPECSENQARIKMHAESAVSVHAAKRFTFVVFCGLTGELIGPPNWIGYEDRMRKIHAAISPAISLDDFKSQIKVRRDSKIVEEWVQGQAKMLHGL